MRNYITLHAVQMNYVQSGNPLVRFEFGETIEQAAIPADQWIQANLPSQLTTSARRVYFLLDKRLLYAHFALFTAQFMTGKLVSGNYAFTIRGDPAPGFQFDVRDFITIDESVRKTWSHGH